MIIVPMLMYHSVDTKSEDYLTVAQEQLDQHVEHLTTHYAVIQVRDVIRYRYEGGTLPDKPIIISFDDSMMDNVKYAVPVLEKFCASAIFFVIAGYLGQNNAWNHRAYRFVDHMRPDDLRNLVAMGHEVGNHSLTHQRLTKLSDAQLHEEFARAHEIIAGTAGTPPYAFSYPYGHADERCFRVCAEFYPFGFASNRQGETNWAANPMNVRRIYIAPDDTPETLDQKITTYRTVAESSRCRIRGTGE